MIPTLSPNPRPHPHPRCPQSVPCPPSPHILTPLCLHHLQGSRRHSPAGPCSPGQAECLQGRHSQSGRGEGDAGEVPGRLGRVPVSVFIPLSPCAGPRENTLTAAHNGPGSRPRVSPVTRAHIPSHGLRSLGHRTGHIQVDRSRKMPSTRPLPASALCPPTCPVPPGMRPQD